MKASKNPATERMISLAKRIASKLDLPEPDYSDIKDTSEFIELNKEDYFWALSVKEGK